jgi:hypothetical protein
LLAAAITRIIDGIRTASSSRSCCGPNCCGGCCCCCCCSPDADPAGSRAYTHFVRGSGGRTLPAATAPRRRRRCRCLPSITHAHNCRLRRLTVRADIAAVTSRCVTYVYTQYVGQQTDGTATEADAHSMLPNASALVDSYLTLSSCCNIIIIFVYSLILPADLRECVAILFNVRSNRSTRLLLG